MHTCGDAAALPLPQLQCVFGSAGLQLRSFLSGGKEPQWLDFDIRSMISERPKALQIRVKWDAQPCDQINVLATLGQLIKNAHGRLLARHLLTSHVALKLRFSSPKPPLLPVARRHSPCSARTCSTALAQPTNELQCLLEVSASLLTQLLMPSTEISGLSVSLKHLEDAFEPGGPTDCDTKVMASAPASTQLHRDDVADLSSHVSSSLVATTSAMDDDRAFVAQGSAPAKWLLDAQEIDPTVLSELPVRLQAELRRDMWLAAGTPTAVSSGGKAPVVRKQSKRRREGGQETLASFLYPGKLS